jgi:hypothetical protein
VPEGRSGMSALGDVAVGSDRSELSHLVRAVDGAPAAVTPTAGEAIPGGEEITLNAGETISYDAAVLQSERNDGPEDAEVIVSNLCGVDEPAGQFHDDMAASTPAA